MKNYFHANHDINGLGLLDKLKCLCNIISMHSCKDSSLNWECSEHVCRSQVTKPQVTS